MGLNLEQVGLNLAFYYPHTDTFYGIHTETIPIKVKILPRHREWSDFVAWQCDNDTHDDGEVIAEFNSASEIWDNPRINGKPFEEAINKSDRKSVVQGKSVDLGGHRIIKK